MKKMRLATLFLSVTLALGLTGCAENQLPVMTNEQMQDVGEYVAITLMKYDANNRSRLVELDADDFLEQEIVITPTPGDVGMKPAVDTPVVDMSGSGNDVTNIETVLSLAEQLQLVYVGKDICDSYPNDGENSYFSLLAADGKQLLVLKFSLTNTGVQDAAIDLLSADEKFTVTVNGGYSRRALTTMLENDLSTIVTTLSGNESKEVVLIVEVSDEMATNITSVQLKIENASKKHTIRIF